MNPIEWLRTKGFASLPQEELDAILHFALLWSLFEAKVLDMRASASSILEVSTRWEHDGLLKAASFRSDFLYFQSRYFENEEFTHNFASLNFRGNDNQQLVEAVLKGEKEDIGAITAALLIIVYRLRNNLFHGLKWADGIRGQLDNFTHANSLLMLALDLNESPVR